MYTCVSHSSPPPDFSPFRSRSYVFFCPLSAFEYPVYRMPLALQLALKSQNVWSSEAPALYARYVIKNDLNYLVGPHMSPFAT